MDETVIINGLSLITMSKTGLDFIQKYECFPVLMDEIDSVNSGIEEKACNKSNNLEACFSVIIGGS